MHDHANMEALLSATLEVERMLVELGEAPFEMLKEEQEKNMIVGKTMVEKWVQNESLINLLKRQIKIQTKSGLTSMASTSFNGCQICKTKNHFATECPKYTTSKPMCLKCWGPDKTENCGLRCGFCGGLRHTEESCWKKNPKISVATTNYLEMYACR